MTTPAATSRPAARNQPTRHPLQVLIVLLLACASFALAQTLVVPALPAIAGHLDASTASTSWILTGFLLSASVATPIIGKLGDLYGRGRVLTVVLTIFALGGVIDALAPNIGVLITGRVLQGVAGGVFPLSFGIVRDTSPRDKVPTHLSLLSAVFGVGGGIGLPLSGVIVDHFDISLLFWVNLLALPAAAAAFLLIPSAPSDHRPRVDWAGAALLSAGLASLLLGVTQAESWGWLSARTVALLAGGVLLVVVWVLVESRVTEPLIELAVLRERAVAATNTAATLIGMAMFASFLLIPQFAQTPESTGYGFGSTVTGAGLLLVPSALVQILAGPVAGHLGGRIGFRRVLALGTFLCAVSFVVLAVAHAAPWEFVVAGMVLGAGICFAFASMANLVVAASPPAQVGIATGINTVMRTVGGAFGAAIATAILSAHVVGRTGLPSESAYTTAFVFSAVVALAATVAALRVPAPVSEQPARSPEPAAAVAD
jgi:EmrB/QacA subfamily drug resistance transporter